MVKVIVWGIPTRVPASVAVAGAASIELTLAVLVNGPGVPEVMTEMEIAGNAVPGDRGKVPV